MNTYSSNRTRQLVLLSIFIAIIIIQSWVPALGYIALPTISLTIIQVTVIVGTIMLGTKEGVLIGFIWGLMSLIRAWMQGSPFERLIFSDPFVSILPRMLMPLVVGLIVQQMIKRDRAPRTIGLVNGLVGSLLNTVFVLGAIVIFKGQEYAEGLEVTTQGLWELLGITVLVNGIPEAVVSAILVPIIVVALSSFLKRRRV